MGHRVLVKVGWAATILAAYLAAVALVLGSMRVWWMVVAFAASGILTGLLLPEPVPGDMLNRSRAMVGSPGSSKR